MKQDERHLAPDDFFVGIDLATRQHQVVVLDLEGRRKTSFKIPHSRDGLRELVHPTRSSQAQPWLHRHLAAFPDPYLKALLAVETMRQLVIDLPAFSPQ